MFCYRLPPLRPGHERQPFRKVLGFILSWPHPPRQPWQDERDEDGGEQVDRVVVQNGLSADSLGGGRLVANHLSDAHVKACKSERV